MEARAGRLTISSSKAGAPHKGLTLDRSCGQPFTLGGLHTGEQRTIDISAALGAGSNTVSLTATGQPGGHAIIVIADS